MHVLVQICNRMLLLASSSIGPLHGPWHPVGPLRLGISMADSEWLAAEAVLDSINQCDVDTRRDLFSGIVLTGAPSLHDARFTSKHHRQCDEPCSRHCL